MIVVELVGGVGNQCFQYAAARTVADRLGVALGLDLRPTRPADCRPYGLGAFSIRAEAIPDDDLLSVHAHHPIGRRSLMDLRDWALARARGARFRSLRRVVEPGAWYSPVIDTVVDHSWLSGYWQSERYFAAHADRIRADLTLKRASPETEARLRTLKQMDFSVAMHVRRGDYAAVASTRAFHGLCEPEYYRAAAEYIRARHPRAGFVFFSDEPGWVAANLAGPQDAIVEGNGDRPHEDLHLMRHCRAHVIANSSFSWWGAWLADSPLVIAPKQWFQSPAMTRHDVVPERWIRL